MSSIIEFDLKMDLSEKETVSRASSLIETTKALLVHMADQKKAHEVLNRESFVRMSAQDFHEFKMSLNLSFTPNPALQNAMRAARKVKRV